MDLIGKKVQHKNNKKIGTITDVSDEFITVCFADGPHNLLKESAFSYIEIEDENEQMALESQAYQFKFHKFKKYYSKALEEEIQYLYKSGGKKYRGTDGTCVSKKYELFVYAFDSDEELYFPSGTEITIDNLNKRIKGSIIYCEEYTVVFQTDSFIGDKVNTITFTTNQSFILNSLKDNLNKLDAEDNPIAYAIACKGRDMLKKDREIKLGQDCAINKALHDDITFIWGPPGTGKTQVLANISLEAITNNKRVLMVSYSNVSVDGALIRVAKMADGKKGQILRYGYPRNMDLLENPYLASYSYALQLNPEISKRYYDLQNRKKNLRTNSKQYVEVKKELNHIRRQLRESERKIIQEGSFIATTVSKAIMDTAINSQKFDYVIFDEASMAYIPQIIFAASLAKTHFVCLGDFRQLPAIVQNSNRSALCQDIFDYVGITEAVENNYNHEWLVLLDEQHRMHPDIADLVSENMYSGRLKTNPKIIMNRREIAACNPLVDKAVGLIDLSYMYSVCIKSGDKSHFNVLSAFICMRIAEKISEKYEVAIITPYHAQSQLLMSMIRDAKKRSDNFQRITTATVHQFQGSEKPVVIYDCVDCFRMAYLGTLLTSMKNNTANRLFNVALTRAQGKVILVGNRDYLMRKHLSTKLLFSKIINSICDSNNMIAGDQVTSYLTKSEKLSGEIFVEDRDSSWDTFINDILKTKRKLLIDIPGSIQDDKSKLKLFENVLNKLNKKNVKITIRIDNRVCTPSFLMPYVVKQNELIANPLTMIDDSIIWFGQPLSEPSFISEGNILLTEYFPSIRFEGEITSKVLKSFIQ